MLPGRWGSPPSPVRVALPGLDEAPKLGRTISLCQASPALETQPHNGIIIPKWPKHHAKGCSALALSHHRVNWSFSHSVPSAHGYLLSWQQPVHIPCYSSSRQLLPETLQSPNSWGHTTHSPPYPPFLTRYRVCLSPAARSQGDLLSLATGDGGSGEQRPKHPTPNQPPRHGSLFWLHTSKPCSKWRVPYLSTLPSGATPNPCEHIYVAPACAITLITTV